MTELLSPSDLHALTGYARKGEQAAWLEAHGVPHKVDGRRVIVARDGVPAIIPPEDVAAWRTRWSVI